MIKMTSPEFGKAISNKPYAILALGSFEQHGPAASLATDYITATAISEILASKLGLILIPGMPYGYSEIHMNFPGTIHIKDDAYLGVISSIVDSLRLHGIKGLVIINGHGGNLIPLRDYLEQNKEFVLFLPWFDLTENRFFEDDHKSHAGSEELSLLAAVAPDCVQINLIENMIPAYIERGEGEPLLMDQFTKNGVHLNADKTDPKIGQDIVKYLIELVTKKINDFINH